MRHVLMRVLALAILVGAAGVSPQLSPVVRAACANPATPYGVDTVTYNVPVAGTFRIWSRIQVPDATNNSFYLQIDGGCPVNVGDAAVTANQLVFVDYQDGNSASKINATLTAGSHTFVLTGREPDVMVDRVVLALNSACVPTGMGDNCADTATPTPAPSSSPTATPVNTVTPTPTATPVANAADLNNDSKVNVFDLSILLSHWGGNSLGDIDKNGVVNVFDLSRLLSAWTG